jgi:hypothetical protein
VTGENPSHHVFIDGDGESQGNLLGDARTAPGGIALLHPHDGFNEFVGGTLGTRLAPASVGEKQAVLALRQNLVKMQEGRRLQHDGRTDPPGRSHKESTPAGDEPIREAEVGSSVSGTIEDQQLMFDEDGLGNYRTDAARLRQSGDGGDEVDENDHEIAHFRMVARN